MTTETTATTGHSVDGETTMTNTNDPPRFMTPEQVQAACGGPDIISLRTIQRLAANKTIPGAIRLGRKLFFQRGPVLRWIQGEGEEPGLRVVR